MLKTAARIRNHLIDVAELISVLVRPVENTQRRVAHGDARQSRKTTAVRVHGPRPMDHPQKGVVREVGQFEVAAVVGTFSGAVSGLEAVRRHDPAPVERTKVHRPFVQSAITGGGVRQTASDAPTKPLVSAFRILRDWSRSAGPESSPGCADTRTHVLIYYKYCQRVIHVDISDPVYSQLQSTHAVTCKVKIRNHRNCFIHFHNVKFHPLLLFHPEHFSSIFFQSDIFS